MRNGRGSGKRQVEIGSGQGEIGSVGEGGLDIPFSTRVNLSKAKTTTTNGCNRKRGRRRESLEWEEERRRFIPPW